jgi:hypothetical protein
MMGIDGLQGPYDYDPQVEDPPHEPVNPMGRYVHDLTASFTWVILLGTTAA